MEGLIINEEEIEEEVEKELPKEDSKLKKTFIFLTGIFLVILMISYIFVSFPISGIIRGIFESTPLDGIKLELDNLTILFEKGTNEIIREYYLNEQKVEFSLCLQGTKKDNIYRINSLYQPQQRQSFNQVTFESCSKESIILFHTHPYKSCLASETDLKTLKKSQKENSEMLMIIMCEPERFSVYW